MPTNPTGFSPRPVQPSQPGPAPSVPATRAADATTIVRAGSPVFSVSGAPPSNSLAGSEALAAGCLHAMEGFILADD